MPVNYSLTDYHDQENISCDSNDKLQLAEQTGDSRMVLKEELRLKIQLKRLQEGKPEMEVTFDEPRQYELSEEEKAKQERRKERNRVAAKNSRNKRKKHQQQVEHKHKELNSENTSLRTDVEKLRKTLRSLQKAALATRRVCSMQPLSQLTLAPFTMGRQAPLSGDGILMNCSDFVQQGPDPRSACCNHVSETAGDVSNLKEIAAYLFSQLSQLENHSGQNEITTTAAEHHPLPHKSVSCDTAFSSTKSKSAERYSPYSTSHSFRPISGKVRMSSVDSSPCSSPSPSFSHESLKIFADIDINSMRRDCQSEY